MHNRVYLDVEICEVFSLFLSYFYVVSIFFFSLLYFALFCVSVCSTTGFYTEDKLRDKK